MMSGSSSSPMPDAVETTHVVGIDIGLESCTMSCLTLEKRQLIKPTPFANTVQGFDWLFARLEELGVAPKQILVGLEATSRYGENLLQALLKRGYQVCLLHPAQMHAFARASRVASENGSARCDHHRPCVAESEKRASAMCPVSRWRPTAN